MADHASPGADPGPSRAGVSASRRWVRWLALGLAAAVCATVAWRHQAPPPRVAASTDADDEQRAVLDPGYLGPDACVRCHAERVKEFRATSHFRACRLPDAETMPPGFAPGRGTHATRDPTLRFELTRAGGDFLQTAVRTTPSGERRSTARIDLVYGTGTADEVYFTWHGERLEELPIAWLHPLKRWGEQPFDLYGTGNFTRGTTPRCLECHNTWFEHVAGTPNRYRRDNLILGVTCERCHGPGRDHVEFHRTHPEADSGRAIVAPARLPRDRQLDLCGQCHSNAVKPRGPAFSYRPGEPLEAHFRTNLNTRPEDDHVANQVPQLRQSKCFQKNDTLTCTTCHDPHRGSAARSASVRRACLKCHQPADCAEQDRMPSAVRGNCVDCHMPRFNRIQVFFHTEDDQYVPVIRPHRHRIAVYPEARQEVLWAWHRTRPDARSRAEADRLAGALAKHWLAEADGFRRQYRFMAEMGALREALRFDPGPAVRGRLRTAVAVQAGLDVDMFTALRQIKQRRFEGAIATLEGTLRTKPDWAKAHGRLGTAYAAAGRREQAVEHLRAVARYDPDDAYGEAMLGWLAYLDGRLEDAVAAYQRADDVEPFNAKTNYHLGLALSRLDRLPEAVECFRRVLTIDPNHAGGCQALADALLRQGQSAEAVRFARRAARLTHFQNADVLLTLAYAYAAAGRSADARATAARALEAARKNNPALVPQIRDAQTAFQAAQGPP